MEENYKCSVTIDNNNRYDYLVEYRGDFIEQMKKIDYACGYTITDRFAIVSVNGDRINDVKKDVPAIIFVNFRSIFALENSTVQDLSGIRPVKTNPYLNLTGKGVLLGIADTGIDYLNREFIYENDESRIEAIWDQTIESKSTVDNLGVYRGALYLNADINKAIEAKMKGENPYDIVPSVDDIGHGTEIASIAGARGYDEEVEGVANGSSFVIVKLRQAGAAKRTLIENGLPDVPLYNIADLVSGIEFLKRYSLKTNKPIIIIISMGSTNHSHDGSDLFSRYINAAASLRGIVFVSGCGNEGLAEGHATGFIKAQGDIVTKELNIPSIIKSFGFRVWVSRPDSMSLAVVSPSGQSSNFIPSQLFSTQNVKYVYENTELKIEEQLVDTVTGIQNINLSFKNIKPGIWKIQMRGDYVLNGRFDIWLPGKDTLPKGTKFLDSNPDETINSPGTVAKVISVGYYNQNNNSIVGESGRGFPLYPVIKPDIAAPGEKVLAVNNKGDKVAVSGSSVATAITAGVCALIVQWGIIDKNDVTMYSAKILSYLIMGAVRDGGIEYPNRSLGYGKLSLVGTFNNIAGIDISSVRGLREYNLNDVYIRIPDDMEVNYIGFRL